MKTFILALVTIMLTACYTGSLNHAATVLAPEDSLATATASLGLDETLQPTRSPTPATKPSLTPIPTSFPNGFDEAQWSIYHSDPQHLWNRMFRRFFSRITSDGKAYGWDSLDPLLWPETTYLLEGTAYQQTVQLLDEFLATDGEQLITDSLKRALFQRDLWAVFDWLGLQADNHVEQRQELQGRIARIMKSLALTEPEILLLPDNYAAVVDSGTFPVSFQNENFDAAFLPADLFAANGEWLCIGRHGGPIATTHTEEFPFFGRSVFLVFVRVPDGRDATLSFIETLNLERSPSLPIGLDVALVRQALLVDKQGDLVLSPIVESIQLRHFGLAQSFYNFGLNRTLLFAGISGGLQPLDKEIMLFRSLGDGFSSGHLEKAEIPDICRACHIDDGLGIGGVTSILSYSRARFPLPNGVRPILGATTPAHEADAVITWKTQQESWQRLKRLWHSAKP